jgi:hypothetical protein
MVINYISYEIIDATISSPEIWRFKISNSDYLAILSDPNQLQLNYDGTLISINTDVYAGSTIPPYPNLWNLSIISGEYYISFITTISKKFNDGISKWLNFYGVFAPTPTPSIDYISEIRARSNYNIVSSGATVTAFTTSQFIIRTFEGDLSGFTSQPISYSKTKDKIVQNQNNIWINLSNLVKEKLEGDIDRFFTSNYTTAIDLGPNETKWATVDTINSYIGTGVTTGYTGYFVVDGFIEPLEQQGQPNQQPLPNLPNILRTNSVKEIERNTFDRVFFKTINLTSANYSYSSAPTTLIDIAYNTGTTSNRKYIQSVMVDNSNLDADYVTYNFRYGTGVNAIRERVTYYFYDECKYQKFQLVFKNKYGMLEALSVNKKSSQSLTTTASDYNRSIINYEGDFNINRHTSKQYNVTGSEQWILNTDWLNEYMNAQMKEAMLTEELWLIDGNGNIIPVVKVDSEIAFKTHLNDKLVQYTIKVKLSHQIIKNIV